jgi:hypothetical protein
VEIRLAVGIYLHPVPVASRVGSGVVSESLGVARFNVGAFVDDVDIAT